MAHSLEVRPPFLDDRIVDFANRLPDDFKLRGSESKYVLRRLMEKKLPHSVLRRPKIGFDIPIHEWFRGVLRPLLLETLSEEAVTSSWLLPLALRAPIAGRSSGAASESGVSLMGPVGPVHLDETVEHRNGSRGIGSGQAAGRSRQRGWIVVVAACLVFLVSVISPPRLVDDVDAVQAQIARNMLSSGDWVTARLDGVAYLEKSPLIYWMMAVSFRSLWGARLGRAPAAGAVGASCCAGLPIALGAGRSATMPVCMPDWRWPPASACFSSLAS